jgi:hypothetical protein
MTDQNHSNDYRPEGATRRVPETDALDRELDAALARYAAVEPRAGLEDRVLAHLQAERELSSAHAAWGWPQVTALAAAVVIVVAVSVWMFRKPTQAVRHLPATQQSTQVGEDSGTATGKPPAPVATRKTSGHGPHRVRRVATAVPKLEVFPSPQPLSEQEQLLANYIAEYPEHALLVARALADPLRPDQLKEMPPFPSGDVATDSMERNNDTTER